MSRQKVNSGWIFSSEQTTGTVVLEGTVVHTDVLLTGDALRVDGGGALAGERADYFVERLLVMGDVNYIPATANLTTRYNTMMNIRIGTINEESMAEMIQNQLWSNANAEFWGRILQDARVPAYADPKDTYNGAALVVDDGVTATVVKDKFGTLGPSTFMFDIQTRFSLQRELDQLIIAIGLDNQYFEDGAFIAATCSWKALVKEYRR